MMASITRTTITSAMNNRASLIVVSASIDSYLGGLFKCLSDMKLITYMPISRVEDIREYQVDNLRLLKPNEFVVFIDNANYIGEIVDMVRKIVEGLVGGVEWWD